MAVGIGGDLAALRRELLGMVAADTQLRAQLAEDGSLFVGYHPRMEELHCRHGRRLQVIIDQVGYPSEEMVGKDGFEAAWLIVQHAISMPALQRQVFAELSKTTGTKYGSGMASLDMAPLLAMLEDRICFFEGRPQRFGTQCDWDETGQLVPWTIADADKVDERRASVGLQPLAVNTTRIQASAQRDGNTAPRDYERRQQEFVAWARRVGWRS